LEQRPEELRGPPPGVAIVTASDERDTIFKTVAGVYSTDRKPGSQLVIITADGQVSLGTIGKDGKPTSAHEAATREWTKYLYMPFLLLDVTPIEMGNGCVGTLRASLTAAIEPSRIIFLV